MHLGTHLREQKKEKRVKSQMHLSVTDWEQKESSHQAGIPLVWKEKLT